VNKALATKSRILDQAVRLSSLLGLAGVTIGKLAEELSLSKSGLYAHFQSKEELQLSVLSTAADEFIRVVIEPALREARGEPRLISLFDRWLNWSLSGPLPGGCIFVAAAVELDDQEGPVRDRLVHFQTEWLKVLARAVRLAQDEGHFLKDEEPEQLAFELHGIMLSFHHRARLLRLSDAAPRARQAYARFSARCRPRGSFTPYEALLERGRAVTLAPSPAAKKLEKKVKRI
jgi:AcrR family transcriptional regulator